MKKLSKFLTVAMCFIFLISTTSCVVLVPTHSVKNSGKHLGWYKNSHNPHNPHHLNTYKNNKSGKKHRTHK